MAKALLWIRYGFCTCLGLTVIGLAAVSAQAPDSEASSMPSPDSLPSL